MYPMLRRQTLLSAAFLLVLIAAPWSVLAASFTDTFSTHPGDADRAPFIWDGSSSSSGAGAWKCTGEALEYRVQDGPAGTMSMSLGGIGLPVTDDTAWTIETGFRHVSGVAPRPAYETIFYVTWFAAQPGEMRILAAMYDAEAQQIKLINGAAEQAPIQADLTGEFHAVRMTGSAGVARLYIDGQEATEPFEIRSRSYAQPPSINIGPITGGDMHTLRYQFDYLAFTTDGAFGPDADPGWTPASASEPVAEGLKPMLVSLEPGENTGITLLRRVKGDEPWRAAIPEHWRKLSAMISNEPGQITTPLYTYPDDNGPSLQNIYRSSMAVALDDKRCVGISHLTRGIDDTRAGFIDYKLWYRVSTDGGETYDAERPLVQLGDEYSPMHPNRYVWIGTNGFCYAAIPPFLQMSNGEILLPCYYAPLGEDGNYYNPLNAYTFTDVAALIGMWDAERNDVNWEASAAVRLGPEQSSRGANECAVIELGEPGHILMVIRGSNQNDATGVIPPVKWKTLSTDYGRTWTECTPFTYDDGEAFWSPSSCSSFIRSSVTGKVYWIGNISRSIPRGNSPRYPLIMAELDEETLTLRRGTLTIIDDRGPDDPPDMQLSNFSLIEDPSTGHIIVYIDRYMSAASGDHPDRGKHTYVIEVE